MDIAAATTIAVWVNILAMHEYDPLSAQACCLSICPPRPPQKFAFPAGLSPLGVSPTVKSASPATSRLVSYAMQGLRRCWMPDIGRYSHRFRFDVPGPSNESIPESDAFYTLNVLVGFSQLPAVAHEPVDIKRTYDGCCRELRSSRVRTYMLGMALWTGAKLDIEPPGSLIDQVKAILASPRALRRSTAQDIGMLVSGTTAMALSEPAMARRGGDARDLSSEALPRSLQSHFL